MEVLKSYRMRIDALDAKIVPLLVERFKVIDEVGHLKARENIPAVLEDRIREVIDNAATKAGTIGSGNYSDFIREIYTLMVTISCDFEEEIKGNK